MNPEPREVELKFELPRGCAESLRRHPALADAPCETVEQTSAYFDTPRRKLFATGLSLRVREARGAFVQTVKAGGEAAGLFDRSEWEASVARLAPDPAALAGTPLEGRGPRLARLEEVCRTEVRRTRWRLDTPGSLIELAFDLATVRAGKRSVDFAEVEIELEEGGIEPLFALARDLARSLPLRVAVASKGERGFDLAAGLHRTVRKAAPIEIAQDSATRDAFRAVAFACLRHFRLNEDLVVEGRDPRALHQARVAMRRLRAALTLFRPAILDQDFVRLRSEIRWFTGELGLARNLDVFMAGHSARLAQGDLARVEEARTRAYDQAIAAIDSERLRMLFLDLLAWLESGAWRDGRKAWMPVRTFAERRLERQWRRVADPGGRLSALDEDQLHELRIEVKKLRYAVEFLGSLYPRRAVKNFARNLEAIQESLGELNDDATARELARDLGLAFAPAPQSAIDGKRTTLLARQFVRLERAGAFWRIG